MLEPIVCYRRDHDRALVVLHGHRRTLAAVQAALTSLPVHVIARPQELDRVIDQMSENSHRAGLTPAEDAAGFAQLEAFGLSAAQTAARTSRKRAVADAGLMVARSELASNASGRWEFLTLEHASVIAEYEDDPGAVKALVAAAKEGGFAHSPAGWPMIVPRRRPRLLRWRS